MTLAAGNLLHDRYRLGSEIGRGGMAVVYRAHDELLDRPVAVKVLTPSNLETAGRARLLREAQAAARLNHPNIVTVHDVGEADGMPFIVMELVEGVSLHERPPASLLDLVRIAAQVCASLDHAHTHGIVHRDLKPENVLLASDGTVKLTDFGLALSVTSRVTSEGAITGTVFYLAPEQALGQAVDGRADLYALGVILYELSAGRLPFVADDPLTVVSQHLHAPAVPPTTYNDLIPPALEALIVHLMSKRPEDRPASAALVRTTLETMDLSGAKQGGERQTSLLDRIARGRLVGREKELQDARAIWQQAAAGASRVLLVSGEPGVGKTRLVRELAAQVAVSGGTVLTGECYAEAMAPYAPIGQIIQQAVDGRSPADLGLAGFVLADLITLSPSLRASHPEVPPNPPTEPEAERHRLSESIALLLAALAQREPVLLILEDTHWADAATLSMVRHLARGARRPAMRLLIVMTYREVELDEARALDEALLDLEREGLTTRIKLARLTREQTSQMLAMLFQDETTPDFLEGIYRETEGNPFFTEEVCKALIEQGVLTREAGRWKRPSIKEMRIPQSLRVALQGRVAKLPEEAQEMLRRAAILGREFDYDLLHAVCDLDEDRLIDALEAAERAQLLEEMRPPGAGRAGARPRLGFVHALIPYTLAESVSGLRRQRLHRRVAEAMERVYAEHLDEVAPRIGRHFSEAGEWDRAVEYLLRAGDVAQKLYAYQEAIAAYEEALGILREQRDREREARTLMKLGSLYHSMLEFPKARRAYQEGFALWQHASSDRGTAAHSPASRPLRLTWNPIQSLDPAYSNDVTHGAILDQLFAGLVERTPEMDIIPDVARSWEVLEGGRKYLFQLRPDVLWSDGVAVTARDFEVAWKRTLDPRLASRNARFLYDIKGALAFHRGERVSPDELGIRAVDPLTLSIELEKPTGYFLHLLAINALYPIPAHVVEAHGASWWQPANLVTNGPFRMEEWRPDDLLVLTRNPQYHGRFGGNVQRVEALLVEAPDWDLCLRQYEADELAYTIIPEWRADEFRHRHPGDHVTGPMAFTEWVWLDLKRPPFSDRRVRQAFAHACDQETMVERCLRGLDPPATGGLMPLGLPGHTPGIGLRFDPTLAQTLLAEAGYPAGRNFPAVEFLVPLSLDRIPHFEYLCSQWHEVLGINPRMEMADPSAFEKRMREDPPSMARSAWLADYPDPDNFFRVGLAHYGDVDWNTEYADLVEMAGRTTDQQAGMSLYGKADRLLIQEAAVIPLIYGRLDLLVQPWVRRFPLSPVRAWFWKDVVIESP